MRSEKCALEHRGVSGGEIPRRFLFHGKHRPPLGGGGCKAAAGTEGGGGRCGARLRQGRRAGRGAGGRCGAERARRAGRGAAGPPASPLPAGSRSFAPARRRPKPAQSAAPFPPFIKNPLRPTTPPFLRPAPLAQGRARRDAAASLPGGAAGRCRGRRRAEWRRRFPVLHCTRRRGSPKGAILSPVFSPQRAPCIPPSKALQ